VADLLAFFSILTGKFIGFGKVFNFWIAFFRYFPLRFVVVPILPRNFFALFLLRIPD